MENFSPGSERNPLEMKVSVRAGNPSPVFETGLGLSARSENVHPGLEG